MSTSIARLSSHNELVIIITNGKKIVILCPTKCAVFQTSICNLGNTKDHRMFFYQNNLRVMMSISH